jgi:Fe-S-cluster containining protein
MTKMPPHSPCVTCNAQCCRHVALSIDKPTTKRDYDHIRWYLNHEHVTVFIDHDHNWFLQFISDCKKLNHDNQCTIYDTRPKICREYPGRNELCEGETNDLPHSQFFSSQTEFEEWLDAQKIDWRFKTL